MTTLAHLSDLHFGREDPVLAHALLASLHALKPDFIVVSGDFTQRAKKRQFRAARAFLRALPKAPLLVVPGNHDVSTTNLFERAMRPLRRYRRYISPDLEPYLETADVAIAGINTVRILATKDGRINALQIERACSQLAAAPAEALRIVVTHHPMDLPAADLKHALVTRAPVAMRAFAAVPPRGVDLFLSGHLHSGLAITTAARYPLPGYSAVVAHAGTAISTRTRKEANAWNLLTLAPGEITIQQMAWNATETTPGTTFTPTTRVSFHRTDSGWHP